jgi:hypothetical protein
VPSRIFAKTAKRLGNYRQERRAIRLFGSAERECALSSALFRRVEVPLALK